MKNKEVVFTDKVIYLKNNIRSIVMDAASKSLTELYCYVVCQNRGDILDVGFGMGFSANKIYELADSYTCIEINPQIYTKAVEWAKDKPNVNIIFGDWSDILPTLTTKFDGIFMDTHDDPNYLNFEQACKSVAKEGCILSIFNYFAIRDKKELNGFEANVDSYNFAKPVPSTHSINWTHFIQGEFVKHGSNKVKFKQTHLI